MTMNKKRRWLLFALLMSVLMPACAFGAPAVMEALFWTIGSDPAVAVLQGEHWGAMICAVLLTISPFIPVLCFILEQIGVRRAKWQLKQEQPPEFATQDKRKEFYQNALKHGRGTRDGAAGVCSAAFGGMAGLVCGSAVRRWGMRRQIAETGSDLETYRNGKPTIYEGPLLLTDRQLRDGVRQLPDERFVYYDASDHSFRCAVSLLSQTNLMQTSYTVAYLPETETILTITDAAGNLRTAGADVALHAPLGYWMYGDLAVPVCTEVKGYADLTAEQQALFDLMYSEVLSEGVAAGEIPTRRFDLPYPLKKDAFNAVLELYEASANAQQRATHGYHTSAVRHHAPADCHVTPRSCKTVHEPA